jgi:RecJ-like exonuclease
MNEECCQKCGSHGWFWDSELEQKIECSECHGTGIVRTCFWCGEFLDELEYDDGVCSMCLDSAANPERENK